MSKICTDIPAAVDQLVELANKYCPGARFCKTEADNHYNDQYDALRVERVTFYDETGLEVGPDFGNDPQQYEEDRYHEAKNNLPVILLSNTYDLYLKQRCNGGNDKMVTISEADLQLLLESVQRDY